MKQDIAIVRATIEDAEQIRTLGIKTFSDTFAADNTAENMKLYLSEGFAPERVLEELNDANTIFFLAYDEKELVGYCKIRESGIPEGLTAKRPLEIERIYSRKDYIGKQIGQKLMQQCLDHARDNGYDVVWLGVWEHNPRAIAFYEKHGFEKFGSHPFMLGKDLQTDLLMKKQLS